MPAKGACSCFSPFYLPAELSAVFAILRLRGTTPDSIDLVNILYIYYILYYIFTKYMLYTYLAAVNSNCSFIQRHHVPVFLACWHANYLLHPSLIAEAPGVCLHRGYGNILFCILISRPCQTSSIVILTEN